MGIRVLFVYSDISGAERYGAKKYYSGVGSLSAVLREAGHETELLYSGYPLDEGELLARVDAVSPDLVAFSTTTHQYPYIVEYARMLKRERPNLVRVCGGTHPTLVPEQVLADEAFDAVCVGEGEYALRDLAACLAVARDYDDIPNLWLMRDGEAIHNAMRPLIADLDELPYVDREVFGYDDILAANGGWVDVMTGRGCPYNCTYCCNPGLKTRYRGLGRYVRFRGVDHVMGELSALVARYPVTTFNFQDDTFTLDKAWTLDFCRAYGERFEISYWINTRVENIREDEIVRALAESGCAGIRVGIENGDEELRANVLGRRMSNDEIVSAFRLVRQHGMKAYTTNMIGIPGETPESIQATIELNRALEPDEFQFSVFYPYPMTTLYDQCVAENLIVPHAEVDSYYAKESVLDLPTLTKAELVTGYERFEALVAELALKRASPSKHALYLRLLKLYSNDATRLQRHLATVKSLRQRARSMIRKIAGKA